MRNTQREGKRNASSSVASLIQFTSFRFEWRARASKVWNILLASQGEEPTLNRQSSSAPCGPGRGSSSPPSHSFVIPPTVVGLGVRARGSAASGAPKGKSGEGIPGDAARWRLSERERAAPGVDAAAAAAVEAEDLAAGEEAPARLAAAAAAAAAAAEEVLWRSLASEGASRSACSKPAALAGCGLVLRARAHASCKLAR